MNATAEIHTVMFRAPSATLASIFIETARISLGIQTGEVQYLSVRPGSTEVVCRVEISGATVEALKRHARIRRDMPTIAETLAPQAEYQDGGAL